MEEQDKLQHRQHRNNALDPDYSPVSSMIAQRGIKTANDFASLMGALMSDLLDGNIEPDVAGAVCQAGDKMLKVVEMQMKYGREDESGEKRLNLLAPKKAATITADRG